jgi:hypothetical protein
MLRDAARDGVLNVEDRWDYGIDFGIWLNGLQIRFSGDVCLN